jgi:hypothetical protein
LRQRCHYGRPAWTKLHRRWLAGLKFDQAVHHIVLEDYIAAVEVAQIRRDRLTAQIEAMLPDWNLAPVVAGAADDARHGAGQCGHADCRTGRSLALHQPANGRLIDRRQRHPAPDPTAKMKDFVAAPLARRTKLRDPPLEKGHGRGRGGQQRARQRDLREWRSRSAKAITGPMTLGGALRARVRLIVWFQGLRAPGRARTDDQVAALCDMTCLTAPGPQHVEPSC